MPSAEFPAYIAAGAALVATVANVLTARFSARFAQKSEVYRWRRDVLLPVLLDFLEASDRHWRFLELWSQEARESDGSTLSMEQAEVERASALGIEAMKKCGGHLQLVAPLEIGMAALKVLASHKDIRSAIERNEHEEVQRQLAILNRRRSVFAVIARLSLKLPMGDSLLMPSVVHDRFLAAMEDD